MEDQFLKLALAIRGVGASIDAVLAALRVEGASQMDCVKVVREIEGVRLGIAKEFVEGSLAWRDTADENSRVREAIVEAMLDSDLGSDEPG